MESQKQYRNLHHISFWEIAIANLALWDIHSSLKYWTDLVAEASVCSSLTMAFLSLKACISGQKPFIPTEWLFVCSKLAMDHRRRTQQNYWKKSQAYGRK